MSSKEKRLLVSATFLVIWTFTNAVSSSAIPPAGKGAVKRDLAASESGHSHFDHGLGGHGGGGGHGGHGGGGGHDGHGGGGSHGGNGHFESQHRDFSNSFKEQGDSRGHHGKDGSKVSEQKGHQHNSKHGSDKAGHSGHNHYFVRNHDERKSGGRGVTSDTSGKHHYADKGHKRQGYRKNKGSTEWGDHQTYHDDYRDGDYDKKHNSNNAYHSSQKINHNDMNEGRKHQLGKQSESQYGVQQRGQYGSRDSQKYNSGGRHSEGSQGHKESDGQFRKQYGSYQMGPVRINHGFFLHGDRGTHNGGRHGGYGNGHGNAGHGSLYDGGAKHGRDHHHHGYQNRGQGFFNDHKHGGYSIGFGNHGHDGFGLGRHLDHGGDRKGIYSFGGRGGTSGGVKGCQNCGRHEGHGMGNKDSSYTIPAGDGGKGGFDWGELRDKLHEGDGIAEIMIKDLGRFHKGDDGGFMGYVGGKDTTHHFLGGGQFEGHPGVDYTNGHDSSRGRQEGDVFKGFGEGFKW